MRRRKGLQGLILATINVLVILGATFIVRSLAAGDPSPSQSSLSLPAESEFALPSPGARAAFASAASPSASSVPSAAGQDTSAQVVPPSGTGWEEAPAIDSEFDELSYGPSRPFAPLVPDSGSWPQLQASASGYGSSSAPSYSRRSGLGGGFSGMGGGFPSGGGGGGRPSNAQNSQIDPASAALRASAAGSPLLPPQAQGDPQGNPFLSGNNSLGGPPMFGLTQFPGLGTGKPVTTSVVLPTSGGSTANVTQLQTPVSVPEPTTALLLGCGLALAAYRNRRRLTPRT